MHRFKCQLTCIEADNLTDFLKEHRKLFIKMRAEIERQQMEANKKEQLFAKVRQENIRLKNMIYKEEFSERVKL